MPRGLSGYVVTFEDKRKFFVRTRSTSVAIYRPPGFVGCLRQYSNPAEIYHPPKKYLIPPKHIWCPRELADPPLKYLIPPKKYDPPPKYMIPP